jgi:hypothetical protein
MEGLKQLRLVIPAKAGIQRRSEGDTGSSRSRGRLALVAALAAFGCSDPTASELGFRLELNLTGTDTIRSSGEARTLDARVSNDAGPHPTSTVQFSVDHPDVIRLVRLNSHMVSLQSLVDGTARVTATFGDLTESIDVVVRRRVARFQLQACGTGSGFGISLAGIVELSPVVHDSIGHVMPLPAPVMYSSDDTTVVLVNVNGHAMGARLGSTFITGRLVLPESTFVVRCSAAVRQPTQ